MSNEEISKEIIVALIQKGLFDQMDNNQSYTSKREERTHAICQAFSSITKTVNDCTGGHYE